jgi:enoyl-CoA hydratase
MNFKRRAETVGWKEAVQDRDNGTWDWTENRPINASDSR